MPWSAKVLPLVPTPNASLSGATGWPIAPQISPPGCMLGNGSTAMCMMPGISAERLLPLMAYLIATFFAPRCVPTNGAKAAMGPPSAPPKMAPSAAVCSSFARSSM